MRKTFLPFSPPAIGEEEIREVVDTLRSGWITTGPKTKQFEKEFKEYLGAPAALALNSGTAAMHTALAALGIGPGDEVITTPMTFCSTVHVIEQVGAKPVLVDIQPDTLNIDPKLVAAAVTPETRAIMPVHYAGHPVDLEPLQQTAKKHNLMIIEDAAHALPAKYMGEFIGSGNNPVAFSFYATKNLTTGEGGMLTGSPELIAKASEISLHGMNRDAWNRYDKGGRWYYEIVRSGFKYNMTDIQAAIGIWQLRKLNKMHNRRCEIVEFYNNAFNKENAIEYPTCKSYVEHAWHLYPIRLRSQDVHGRNHFIEELHRQNIGSSVHFIPVHIHPYYKSKYGFKPLDFPIALDNFERLITLPLYSTLSDEDIENVVEAVLKISQAKTT